MKARLLTFIFCLITFCTLAFSQATICTICHKPNCQIQHKKCTTCGEWDYKCHYNCNHPAPKCSICGKSKCPQKEKHKVCPTCKKYDFQCEYNLNHPCSQCGSKVCKTKNSHPKCSDCKKLIGVKVNPCSHNGKHPKCECGKLIEPGYENSCYYGGEHPTCAICKKQIGIPNSNSCQYNGDHRYKVSFKCNVSDARICVDDSLVCSPNDYCVLKHGNHTVSISAENYRTRRESIEVEKPDVSYSFSLSKLPTNGYKKTISVNGVEFNMIYVHGGTFTMGTNDFEINEALLATNEEPSWQQGVTKETPHSVELSNYYIGETEVTQELWNALYGLGLDTSDEYKQLPKDRISWNQWQKFISKLNSLTGMEFRMPTEAEWEYAARGGKNGNPTLYAGSNNLSVVGWYVGNEYTDKERQKRGNEFGVHPVKAKMSNELGIRDMSGNVAEWCSDWWGKYSNGEEINPTGPQNGSYKIYRGGSWSSPMRSCFVFERGYTGPDISGDIGLRLVLSDQDF